MTGPDTDPALVREARDLSAVLRHKFDWVNDDKRGTRTAVHDEDNCDLCRLAAAAERADEERVLREQIEDDHWPYEWQVATAEREKRKAAEAALLAAQQEQTRLREALSDFLDATDTFNPERYKHYKERARAALAQDTETKE